MENKENEEYKNKIKKLIDRVEKGNSTPEEQLLEAKELLLKTAKSRIHPYYRSERIILAFIYTIRDYYNRRASSLVKNQFQKEIDNLYRLLFEELIKPNPNINPSDPKFKKKAEKLDRKRILKKMTIILGMENLFRDFYKHYDIKEATRTDYTMEIILYIIGIIVLLVGFPILMSLGFFKAPGT